MSSYKVSEPSALKFLKANGVVVDENGNVVNDATDYWKKVYDQAEPKVAKYLHADGTIDENPGSGGGADLEDNKEVSITENGTIEILPTEGKDGMKKVTATVNVPSSGVTEPFSVDVAGYDTIPIIIAPMNTQILGVFDDGNIIPYTDCFVQDPKTPLSSNTNYCPSNILSDPFDIYELDVAHGGKFYIPKNNVTGDPSAQELYEIAGDSFSLTKDTTITSGKTYYQLLPHENLEFAFSSLSRLYSVDINGSIQEI